VYSPVLARERVKTLILWKVEEMNAKKRVGARTAPFARLGKAAKTSIGKIRKHQMAPLKRLGKGSWLAKYPLKSGKGKRIQWGRVMMKLNIRAPLKFQWGRVRTKVSITKIRKHQVAPLKIQWGRLRAKRETEPG
jgi:hypothetical protein